MTSPEWEAANEDDADRYPQTPPLPRPESTHSPEWAENGSPATGNATGAREAKYAEAIMGEAWGDAIDAARAEVERLTEHKAEWRDAAHTNKRQWMDAIARAEAAEDALQSLRERIEALHHEAIEDCLAAGWCEEDGRPWPCSTAVALAAAPAVSSGEATELPNGSRLAHNGIVNDTDNRAGLDAPVSSGEAATCEAVQS